ncbi:hypothetical protein D6777_01525 [Candidatus Woesearchaeota archaeon]|nr:MAG: hypothetical protein D6777_01525 [Candidatus Woesearchaeota archaeon]
MVKEDVSNKTVLVLAILVVLIVASSMWLVLNKLSNIDYKQPPVRTVTITKVVEQAAPTGGVVGLTITKPPKGEVTENE